MDQADLDNRSGQDDWYLRSGMCSEEILKKKCKSYFTTGYKRIYSTMPIGIGYSGLPGGSFYRSFYRRENMA